MRRKYGWIAVLFLTLAALAQTQSKPRNVKPHSAAATSTRLPSRATVNSFLQHMFGYDPSLSWTVVSIQPSPEPAIAQVTLNISAPQKSGQQSMYILPGHKQALLGEMAPFPGEPGAPRPSDSAINSFVRQMTGGNPAVTWTLAEVKPQAVTNLTRVTIVATTPQGRGAVEFYVTPDNKYALRGDVAPFGADPFAVDRAKLQKGVNGPARGPANARLLIVEFGDLQCPACKAANPEIERLVKDEPNARFVFQQFPLTQMHHWAFEAAEFGDCVYRQDPAAFWKFMDGVYAAQEKITGDTNNTDDAGKKAQPDLMQLASAAGANGSKVAACAKEPGTAERIKRSMELGKELDVTSTPTLFINGRKIPNLGQVPYDKLKGMADYLAKK